MVAIPPLFLREEMRRVSTHAVKDSDMKKHTVYGRYGKARFKVKSNLAKYEDLQYHWRVKRGYGYCSNLLYKSGMTPSGGRWASGRSTHGQPLYGHTSYKNDIRPRLWYYEYEDEKQKKRKDWYTPDPKAIARSRLKYDYMMSGWHWIDDEMSEYYGAEGRLVTSMSCELVIRWVRDDVSHTHSMSDSLVQLDCTPPGMWFPTALLSRPTNKNAPGYKNALAKARSERAQKRIVNTFQAEQTMQFEKHDDTDALINVFGDE